MACASARVLGAQPLELPRAACRRTMDTLSSDLASHWVKIPTSSVPVLPTGNRPLLRSRHRGRPPLWRRDPEGMRPPSPATPRPWTRRSSSRLVRLPDRRRRLLRRLPDASAGVGAALAAQRAFASEPGRRDADPRAHGPPHRHGRAAGEQVGEYAPLTYRAARLISVGHGGQILVSAARGSCSAMMAAAHVELRDLGEHRLRDLASAEHIFQVVRPACRPTSRRSRRSTRSPTICRASSPASSGASASWPRFGGCWPRRGC